MKCSQQCDGYKLSIVYFSLLLLCLFMIFLSQNGLTKNSQFLTHYSNIKEVSSFEYWHCQMAMCIYLVNCQNRSMHFQLVKIKRLPISDYCIYRYKTTEIVVDPHH